MDGLTLPGGLPLLLASYLDECPPERHAEARAALLLCAQHVTPAQLPDLPPRSPAAAPSSIAGVSSGTAGALSIRQSAQVALTPQQEVELLLRDAGESFLRGDHDLAVQLYRCAGQVGWAPLVAALVASGRVTEALDLVSAATALEISGMARGGRAGPQGDGYVAVTTVATGLVPPRDAAAAQGQRGLLGSREMAHLLSHYLVRLLRGGMEAEGGPQRAEFPSPITLASINLG